MLPALVSLLQCRRLRHEIAPSEIDSVKSRSRELHFASSCRPSHQAVPLPLSELFSWYKASGLPGVRVVTLSCVMVCRVYTQKLLKSLGLVIHCKIPPKQELHASPWASSEVCELNRRRTEILLSPQYDAMCRFEAAPLPFTTSAS